MHFRTKANSINILEIPRLDIPQIAQLFAVMRHESKAMLAISSD